MGLNAELVGKEYPDGTYEVNAEAIQKYAAATNEDNPAFTGDSPVAPPCFPIVPAGTAMGNAVMDPDLGATPNIARLVHGEEDHVLHLPIKAGDKLTVRSKLESVESKESGETFTVYTTLVNQEGRQAAEVRSLMFIRGTGGSRSKGAEDTQTPEIAFEVDQKVDADQTYRYAEASGDHNPIHVDEDFAKNMAGLPGIILHGMCTMALASKAVLDEACAGDPSRLKRIKVRFSKPVFPGQTLTTRGWVEDGGNGIKVFGFEVLNPEGTQVIRGGVAEVSD
ncbi:MAG: MaoC/PaaZ C-terminal domain-containing protein [Actinomycetota bacterium]